jgi:GNAT superfamily N-acetyltransferase
VILEDHMMTLFDALQEEESVWQKVYSFREWAALGWRTYWHPPAPQTPHWNIAYPMIATATLSWGQTEALSRFYAQVGIPGHVLDISGRFADRAISQDEYFFRPRAGTTEPPDPKVTVAEDLLEFSKLVGAGFDLPENTLPDFVNQLEKLARDAHPVHLIALEHGVPAGVISTFRTAAGYDFIMNLTTLPAFRGKGVARRLMGEIARRSQCGIIMRTPNKFLRERVIPALGFRSIGVANIVPLATLNSRRDDD